MTTLVATQTNSRGNKKVDLLLGKVKREDQGKRTDGRRKVLPHSSGLHIAVSEVKNRRDSFFTYKLILVLGSRDQSGSVAPYYVEALSLDFPEDGGIRTIKVTDGGTPSPTEVVSVYNCYAWFYIPLEGIRSEQCMLHTTQINVEENLMAKHRGNLPHSNMQDQIIVDVIKYYLRHMSPSTELKISDLDKKEFRPDLLRSGGAGRVRELSRDGVWNNLL